MRVALEIEDMIEVSLYYGFPDSSSNENFACLCHVPYNASFNQLYRAAAKALGYKKVSFTLHHVEDELPRNKLPHGFTDNCVKLWI